MCRCQIANPKRCQQTFTEGKIHKQFRLSVRIHRISEAVLYESPQRIITGFIWTFSGDVSVQGVCLCNRERQRHVEQKSDIETDDERRFPASSACFSTQSFSVWSEQWRRLCSSAWGVNVSPDKDTVYRVIIGSVLRLETHRAEGGRRSRRAETESSGEFSTLRTSWRNCR